MSNQDIFLEGVGDVIICKPTQNTVLSSINALPLIEAPPNFEDQFLLYIMFVTVVPGSLNLI